MASIISASTTSATAFNVSADTSGVLQIATGATPTTALTIDTSQNVGIGTTSPSVKLHVASSSLAAIQANITSSGAGNVARFQLTSPTSNYGWYVPDNFNYLSLYDYNAGSERMRIDSSGNVGIGTTSPASKLDILSDAVTGFQVKTADSNKSYISLGVSSSGAATYIVSGQTGTGTYLPITFFTGGNERMRIDSSGYVTNAVNGLGNGLHQAQLYYRLNSTNVGSNATGAQSVFGVGVTLVGSTQYEFEAVIALSKSAGTTSHTIGLGFGGTATLNNIAYELISSPIVSTSFVARLETVQTIMFIQTASNTTTTSASASAAAYVTYVLKGTVSVNAGGTFIPQYTLSAAPGGAYTTAIGSYIKISPLAASGANVNIGSWA